MNAYASCDSPTYGFYLSPYIPLSTLWRGGLKGVRSFAFHLYFPPRSHVDVRFRFKTRCFAFAQHDKPTSHEGLPTRLIFYSSSIIDFIIKGLRLNSFDNSVFVISCPSFVIEISTTSMVIQTSPQFIGEQI